MERDFATSPEKQIIIPQEANMEEEKTHPEEEKAHPEKEKTHPMIGAFTAVGAATGFLISKERGGSLGNVMLLSGIGAIVGSIIARVLRQMYLFFKKKKNNSAK